MRKVLITATAIGAVLLAGCGGDDNAQNDAYDQVSKAASQRSPYIPKNGVEFDNYNKAQELYDNPTTIQWCTAFPQNPSAPIITVPIAGKLTSSTTSYFPSERAYDQSGDNGDLALPARSVDGLYHPNPPPYRYGFTPGGQYVDFTDLQTLCTTKPLEFQRQSVAVKVDSSLNSATQRASDALSQGDKDEAQRILEGATGGQLERRCLGAAR